MAEGRTRAKNRTNSIVPIIFTTIFGYFAIAIWAALFVPKLTIATGVSMFIWLEICQLTALTIILLLLGMKNGKCA